MMNTGFGDAAEVLLSTAFRLTLARLAHPPAGRGRAESKGLAMEERPREKRTADELALMIQADLSRMDGCPQQGVTVTVYGIPWKAMLMFGAAAGPVRNKAELQRFFEIITERTQRLYDIA
jgi:hypothetical protein